MLDRAPWSAPRRRRGHEFSAPFTLDVSFAGRDLDCKFLDELLEGVDPCGENGAFHTFVWDAPICSEPISCRLGQVKRETGSSSAMSSGSEGCLAPSKWLPKRSQLTDENG